MLAEGIRPPQMHGSMLVAAQRFGNTKHAAWIPLALHSATERSVASGDGVGAAEHEGEKMLGEVVDLDVEERGFLRTVKNCEEASCRSHRCGRSVCLGMSAGGCSGRDLG